MIFFFKFIILIFPILIGVAFLTLLERKILSLVGVRLGPNKVSFFGILQPISDALKLANKQFNLLSNFSFFFYYISSFLMLFSAFFLWLCFCSYPESIFFNFSILIIMIILGFNSLNSIISGWSTYGKFSLIGSIRTVSQLVSYESVLYLCFFFFIYFYFSFDLNSFMFLPLGFTFFFIPFCFYIWIPSFLAELNRTPYDFSEGESELVSGFNTDFSSSSFTFIFLSEYSNIFFFCFLGSFFFFFFFPFFFFTMFVFFVIWIRSVLPRFRFDKLMLLSWKFFIPFLTLMFLCSIFFIL